MGLLNTATDPYDPYGLSASSVLGGNIPPIPGAPAAPPAISTDPKAPVFGQPSGKTTGGGGNGTGGFDANALPTFTLPTLPKFTPPPFVEPTAESALSDPGYQFRLQQGTDALQHSAAAGGVLRTGGTLKGLIDYSQNAASQEYANVYGRALDKYRTVDYQGAHDMFAPLLLGYQTNANAAIQAALARYDRQYNVWAHLTPQAAYHAPNIPPFQYQPLGSPA